MSFTNQPYIMQKLLQILAFSCCFFISLSAQTSDFAPLGVRLPRMFSPFMRILLSIFIFSFVSTLQAQPDETFVKSFDPNPQNIFQADKGGYIWSIGDYIFIVNGFVKNSIGDRAHQIYKINASTHEIEKEIAVEGPQGDIAISAYWVTSDEHVLITGEWRDHNAGGIMRMFLMKLNPELEVLWVNYYPTLTNSYLYSEGVVEIDNGDLLIYVAESLDLPPHKAGELRVFKTDSIGNILFSKLLVDTFTQTVGYGDIVPTDDGNFIITSYVIGYYYHPLQGTYREMAILHKIDKDANTIWTRSLNYAKFLLQEPKIAPTPGGGCAVMWQKDTNTVDPQVAWNFTALNGMDSEGNRTWTHEWNKWGYKIMYNIKQTLNSDIIGVAYYQLASSPRGKSLLTRLTSTGDKVWERIYSDSIQRPWSPQLELLDICEMADGRIAATGIVFDTNYLGYLNPNIGLLVVDKDGCLEPGCGEGIQYISSASEPLFRLPDLPIMGVTPNPSNGPIRVTLPENMPKSKNNFELRCFNSNGQLIQRFEWTPDISVLDLPSFAVPNGLYRLILYDGNWPVANGKFIFQH
jgi:hypothetical protein